MLMAIQGQLKSGPLQSFDNASRIESHAHGGFRVLRVDDILG